MKIKHIVIFVSILLAENILVARIPENLTGTDRFPYTEVAGIPLGALNLSVGAEFFTVVAQRLYNVAHLCIRQKDEELPIINLGDGGIETKPAKEPKGGKGSKVSYVFVDENLANTVSTNINPVAILMHALFHQQEQTTEMSDFKVSRLAQVVRGEKGVSLEKTLEGWAEFIEFVCTTYTSKEKRLVPLTNKNCVVNAYTRAPIFQSKPDIKALIIKISAWAESVGLNKDLPLRILMAGVYDLCGHDKLLINSFYGQLTPKIQRLLESQDTYKKTADPQSANLGAASGAGEEDPKFADTICKLLNTYLGSFVPLHYKAVRLNSKEYADCFETTVRNVILSLILQRDGTFKSDVLRPEYKAFVNKYPTMIAQATLEAHNEWVALVATVPGVLYVIDPSGGKLTELKSSFKSLILALNYIFDLKIEAFNSFTKDSPIAIESLEEQSVDKEFIEKNLSEVIRLINLNEGFSVDIRCQGVDYTPGEKINFLVTTPVVELRGYINVGTHSGVNSDKSKTIFNLETISGAHTVRSFFPFITHALSTRNFDINRKASFLLNSLSLDPSVDNSKEIPQLIEYDIELAHVHLLANIILSNQAEGNILNSIMNMLTLIKSIKDKNPSLLDDDFLLSRFFSIALALSNHNLLDVRNKCIEIFKLLWEINKGFFEALTVIGKLISLKNQHKTNRYDESIKIMITMLLEKNGSFVDALVEELDRCILLYENDRDQSIFLDSFELIVESFPPSVTVDAEKKSKFVAKLEKLKDEDDSYFHNEMIDKLIALFKP